MSTRTSSRRWWPWVVGGGLVVLLGAALGAVVMTFPAAAATTCPGCYGLERLGPGLYVEQGLSVRQRRHVAEATERAQQRVRDFYHGRQSSPRVLACLTRECYRQIGGGGEAGSAVLNRAVMLSPRGVNPVILAHELSHVELHRHLGSDGDVPQWFDEGLAVVVADDRRYLRPPGAADRCRVSSQEELPVTLQDWLRTASADHQLYAKSGCRVSRWIGAHGGRSAVLDLIDRLAAGGTFKTSYSAGR